MKQDLLTGNRKKGLSIMAVKDDSFTSDNIQDEHWFEGDEALAKLYNAISKLTHNQRIVFNMRYFEEFSYEDIASVTNQPIDSLKKSYLFSVKKIEKTIMGI